MKKNPLSIYKMTGTEVPFRYNLYVWLAQVATVLLDPILYPFGYCCGLGIDASTNRLRWGLAHWSAERAAKAQREDT